MGIQFVGRATGGVEDSNTSYSVSLTSLTGGIASAAAAGDVVVVVAAQSGLGLGDVDIGATGYTEIADLFSNDTYQCNLSVAYKVMGGSPDSTVTIAKSGSGSAYAAAAIVEVWRGVDPSVLSVTSTTATGVNTDRADAASITPAHVGSVILACCAAAQQSASASLTGPSGMSDIAQHAVSGSGTVPSRVVVGHYTWSSGAYDPAALTDGNNSAFESWAAVTLALRPAPSTHYVVYLASATDPADNSTGYGQIIAGQDGSGAAAAASGSIVAPTADATDSALATITGLSASTAYTAAAVWWDGASDYGDGRILSADITTSSAALDASPASAAAAGADAQIIRTMQISVVPGTAVADGSSAGVALSLTVGASSAGAAADGATASVSSALTIGAAPAQATADGATASVSLAWIIATAPGEAAADGAAAQIILGGNINATPAEATASGAAASVSLATIIAASPADASANGAEAEVIEQATINSDPATAAANGAVAAIIRTLLVGATPADGAASGADAEVISGGAATAAEVWDYVLSNGLTAEQTLVQIHEWLSDLHRIHGLELGSPLTVTATERAAADITQSIAELAGTVTVTRQ